MPIVSDQRAQSFFFLKAGGTLVLFAGLYGILDLAVEEIFSVASNTSTSSAAATGQGYVESIWTWLPLGAIGLILLMMLAAAIFSSGGGVR